VWEGEVSTRDSVCVTDGPCDGERADQRDAKARGGGALGVWWWMVVRDRVACVLDYECVSVCVVRCWCGVQIVRNVRCGCGKVRVMQYG
jgi:hypothetical protein